jgi:hypothetical protein
MSNNKYKYIDCYLWKIMEYTIVTYMIVLSIVVFWLMWHNFPDDVFLKYYITVWVYWGCCAITSIMFFFVYRFGYFVFETEEQIDSERGISYKEGIKILATMIITTGLVGAICFIFFH